MKLTLISTNLEKIIFIFMKTIFIIFYKYENNFEKKIILKKNNFEKNNFEKK